MLQVHQQQSWSVAVRAKSRNFYFSLKASKILPLPKIFRFSVRFKLHPFHFRIKSEPHSSSFWRPKTLKRKLFQIFRRKRIKRDDSVGTLCSRKCSGCVSVALIGTLVPRLCKLIRGHDCFALLWLCFLGLGLRNCWSGGIRRRWLMIVLVSAAGMQQLDNGVLWDYLSSSWISFSRLK